MYRILFLALFITGLCNHLVLHADSLAPRSQLSLDGPGWKVWMDQKAQWGNDTLYAPGEVPPLAQLPVNMPSGGWNSPRQFGTSCSSPACVEEIFANGNPAFEYHGVSWFVKTVAIPSSWKGKSVQLDIVRTRLRVEVYVNRKLAGYDLCMESPCSFDLTQFVKAGEANEIAIRLTNPGGSRGYDDTRLTHWGDNRLPSGRDFAGLDTVTLTATDTVHLYNVFVMNQLPAKGNRIQVVPSVTNPSDHAMDAKLTAEIVPVSGGAVLSTETWRGQIAAGGCEIPSPVFAVPSAKLWNLDTPNLYICRLSLKTASHADSTATRFGFRVFEVKPRQDGKLCFYLNGRRFRDRSAIDFGYYAHTGMFATSGEVRRSIQASKDIGFNGINLHRHIGEYRMLNAADEMGEAMYEEPGGLHELQGEAVEPDTLADKIIQEKVRRMAIRDRNHPSLLIHNLSNEDNFWGVVREQAMRTIHKINPTVMVCNASGHAAGGYIPGKIDYQHSQASGFDNYMRPYDDIIRNDYQDDHTVGSTPLFDEYTLRSHDRPTGNNLFYFGEVFCYTGPADWWLTAQQSTEADGSYDLATYSLNHDKIENAFADLNLSKIGSRNIKSPADISRQAGLGLMYMDGRLAQRIMSRDNVDGFAINGWSAHSYVTLPSNTPPDDPWDSAIVDEGRNLKGPAEDFRYWTRTAQVALFRRSNKFVKPGDSAMFEMCLINEGHIPSGQYQIDLSVTDGIGKTTDFAETQPVTVVGGDTYAQPLGDVTVPIPSEWHAGHITLCAQIKDTAGRVVADGKEQVLLQNRPTWKADLSGINISAVNWPAAQSALSDAGVPLVGQNDADVVLAGDMSGSSDDQLGDLLARARSGATLILKFDPSWAAILHDKGILTEPVTQWGGVQSGEANGWFGNGWGYLDHFVGDQAVPSITTIGTTSWEVPGDPVGFWPLKTAGRKYAYGLYVARTNAFFNEPNTYSVDPALIQGADQKELYSSCYYDLNNIDLHIPNGEYKVTLQFCEPYFDGPGKRVFDVSVQQKLVVKGLDIFAAVGKLKPYDVSTENVAVTNGRLAISLGAGNCLSGIVVNGRQSNGAPYIRKICCGKQATDGYSLLQYSELSTLQPSLLILMGGFDYGNGKILLDSSYPVDMNSPLSDMLFYNMIRQGSKREL